MGVKDIWCEFRFTRFRCCLRLLFAGLWPLVSVLIALHMDDISALFPARSLKKKILGFPHKVIYTVPLLLIFYKRRRTILLTEECM